MEKIRIKTTAIYFVMALLFCMMILRVFNLSKGEELLEAAQQNGSYTLTVATTRGTIFDCNMRPITGWQPGVMAAVTPEPETIAAITNVVGVDKMESIKNRMSSGKPLIVQLPQPITGVEGIDCFYVSPRYRDDQILPHILGYVDESGTGVTGIEKSYNDWLSKNKGHIQVRYAVNALGRPLAGVAPAIDDTSYKSNQGVVLTIDSKIQKIAEEAASIYLEEGAVVIAELDSGKIRACASNPVFSPNDLAAAMQSKDSPFVNRALSAYNVGSIFKIVTAAAALEAGISPEYEYECTGSVNVGGVVFNCNNKSGHGKLKMEGALAHSCNTYFVSLAQKTGAKPLHDMAEKMGFANSIELCDGITAASGTFPTMDTLASPAALANLSFGQGELMATPVQMTRVMSAVANDGLIPSLSLVEGLTDEKGEMFMTSEGFDPIRIMSSKTSKTLQSMLTSPLIYGTAKAAQPRFVTAAGKTATAETGIIRDGKQICQTWFMGYFPAENPKYVVVALAENSRNGAKTTSPTFQYIANQMYHDGYTGDTAVK